MRTMYGKRIDACDVARLARHAAETVLCSLDVDGEADFQEVPREVRRVIFNLAIARVLEVVNCPNEILSAENAYAEVCGRFRLRLLGLCADLRDRHSDLMRSACGNGEVSGDGSLFDSSGPVVPEESGFVCVDCRRAIMEGEPMWSVNVHHEVFEGGAISVLRADCYLVLCEACAGKRDLRRVGVPRRDLE